MRRVVASFLALGLSLFVFACQKTATRPDPRQLMVQLSGEPASLDPTLVEEGLSFRILINLMDGLLGYDGEGNLTSRLAESYEISKDQKTYSFKIKPDSKWSDGVLVTGAQIQFAIERALNPKSGSKLSGFLRIIDKMESDQNSIRFILKKPSYSFLQVLTLPITYPLRKEVLDANQGKWDPLRGKNVPTNGFYKIESYEPEQKLVLISTQPQSSAPQKVVLRFIADEATGSHLFEQGQLDVLSRIPAYDHKKYEKADAYRVVPFLATYFLGFNLKKNPFQDRTFRQAVAGSIKKSELVQALGSGEVPARSWIPKGLEGFEPYQENEQGLDPRFAEVAQKVKRQNYKKTVVAGFDSSGRNALVMEKIQADLKSQLGWKVVLNNTDWKTFIQSVYRDPAPLFRFGWSSPMMDPLIFLTSFTTNDPFTFTHYSNPRFDQLVEEIQALKPGRIRDQKILKAQKILVEEETLIVPLYHYVSTQVVGPRIETYRVNPFGHTRYEEVRLKHFINE
jgi:oligopeptide transport system substrate-binding protein